MLYLVESLPKRCLANQFLRQGPYYRNIVSFLESNITVNRGYLRQNWDISVNREKVSGISAAVNCDSRDGTYVKDCDTGMRP